MPNQFTDVAERNGAHGLNAETALDETMFYWSMPENRLELWAWLESSRLSDTVPREFYKERSVVLDNTIVGRHAVVENAILDKNVEVPEGAVIGVDKEHDKARGFVVSEGGITVVGKGQLVEL